jgi:hypothetical protein
MTKSKDLELILNSIKARKSLQFVKSLFKTVNRLYRECIDRVQTKSSAISSLQDDMDTQASRIVYPSVTVTQLLEEVPEGLTVITELDVVDHVFSPLKQALIDGCSPDVSSTYLIAIAMAYCSSLLSFFIYPHKRLQLFMFDLCVDCEKPSSLQQLLNFHVILDSNELLEKLAVLEMSNAFPWVSQCRIDVAKRMKKTQLVIKTLIVRGREDEVVEYLRKEDPSFDVESLLSILTELGKDVSGPVAKKLWNQIQLWNISSDVTKPVLTRDIVLGNSDSDISPYVTDCRDFTVIYVQP